MPISCCKLRSSSRIWIWTVASSAVVGSSASSSLGRHDRAMAIMARWRNPARELVRERGEPALRRGDLHQLQQFQRPPIGFAATAPLVAQ